MRTLIVIILGVILSLAFVFGAGWLNKSRMQGAYLFAAVWLIFCAVDFYLGVKAGYAPLEELGIHAVIFALPALAAYFCSRSA